MKPSLLSVTVYVSVGSCSSVKKPLLSVAVRCASDGDTAVTDTPAMPAPVFSSTIVPRNDPVTPPAAIACCVHNEKSALPITSAHDTGTRKRLETFTDAIAVLHRKKRRAMSQEIAH